MRRPLLPLLVLLTAAACARSRDPLPVAPASADVPPLLSPPPSTAPPADPGPPDPGAAAPPAPPADTEIAVSRDGKRRLLSRTRLTDAGASLRDFLLRDAAGKDTLVLQEDPSKFLDGTGDLPLTQIFGVSFDPDEARVLFSVPNGRGEAIGAVDLRTRKTAWITSAFGAEHVVVPRGASRGHILVYKHLYYPDRPGSYDQCWLVDGWTGKKLRDLTRVDSECLASPEMKKALGF